jgi:AcrR family transcriptional regulator
MTRPADADELEELEDDIEDTSADAPDDADDGDHRRRPRRRGAELRRAIYQATIDELTENGYAELTMDRVAARAKASKGSLYRRWGGRAELVIAAINNLKDDYQPPPDGGDLRGELLALLRTIAESLEGARGEAMRGLMAELSRHPDLARTVRAEIVDSALPPMLEVLRRGVVRGEVRPGALTPLVSRVGPSLIRQSMMFGASGVDLAFIEQVVDEVVLPLVIAHSDDPKG